MTLTWANAATELLGKTAVVEIQHYDEKGVFQRYEHCWGKVILADEQQGIHVHVQGQTFQGKRMILPPNLTSVVRPREENGVFRLEATGEHVSEPDWFITWSLIAKPDAKATPGTGARG